VASPALPVTKDNLLDLWQTVYHAPPTARSPRDELTLSDRPGQRLPAAPNSCSFQLGGAMSEVITGASTATPDAVRMTGVVKSFGGACAAGRRLEHRQGEIHALLGGNGAGKSTILKILNGVHVPDEGTIEVDGTPLTEHSPEAARRAGISMIFQEMSLMPTLSVAQNIFLTREARDRIGMIDDRQAERQARVLFGELGVDIDPKLRCPT
jgi:hypothetical protein